VNERIWHMILPTTFFFPSTTFGCISPEQRITTSSNTIPSSSEDGHIDSERFRPIKEKPPACHVEEC
jgi:hypothetical protein